MSCVLHLCFVAMVRAAKTPKWMLRQRSRHSAHWRYSDNERRIQCEVCLTGRIR